MPEHKTIFRLPKQRYMVIAAIVILIIMLVSAITLKIFTVENDGFKSDMPTFIVKRGPFRINIVEAGTIKAREQVVLKSQVEGRTTILSLIPEGTLVSKGDLLVELDVSKLLDNKIDQEIRVQNADAAFVRARENLAVVKNQAQSDKDKAELTLEFARQDLEKYKAGEYRNKLMEAEGRITLADEELKRAENRLYWSKKLFKEKYISETKLQEDQLATNKAALDLKLKKSDLWLLENFTYKRDVAQLESDVKQAAMALERTNRKAKADVIQAEAELRAKESEFKRQKDKLQKIEDQIAKTKIYAPADGLAIYATSAKGSWRGNAEPLEEGREVREREELIYLPTALSMKADVKIHEASMKKIKINLRATIEVDALPGKVFTGTVGKIAPLPDAQMIWLNPDLKVYNTEIYIDNEDSDLRTGMSCKAQIIIEEYDDATYIPLQAIVRTNGQPTVYIVTAKSIDPREVEIGMDNNRMVHIISGLQPGETVLLTPPLAAGTVETNISANPKEPAAEKKPAGPWGEAPSKTKKR